MSYKYVYLWYTFVKNHDFNWKQNVCFYLIEKKILYDNILKKIIIK